MMNDVALLAAVTATSGAAAAPTLPKATKLCPRPSHSVLEARARGIARFFSL